jgi:hypothetical protein
MNKLTDKFINDVLSYGESLIGIPYKWWQGKNFRSDIGPFWSGGNKEVSFSTINCCNCTGLLNLIRRKFNLSIPGFNRPLCEYPGGTYEWFKYLTEKLERNGVLLQYHLFDTNKSYPKGTLLFRPYNDINDQGHVAIVFSHNNNILDNNLLHCYPEDGIVRDGLIKPGITIDELVRTSHNWNKYGFYSYAFLPEIWLTE